MLNNNPDQRDAGEIADVHVPDATRDAPTRNSDSLKRSDPGDTSTPHTRSIAEAFGYEVPQRSPQAGVESEDIHGQFFGHGPKDYHRSDERIREEVSQRLTTHPDIDASEVEVQVSGGVVTLSGVVEDRHEKRLAEYIAEDGIGVDDVDNRLKIRHRFWASLTGERASEHGRPKG